MDPQKAKIRSVMWWMGCCLLMLWPPSLPQSYPFPNKDIKPTLVVNGGKKMMMEKEEDGVGKGRGQVRFKGNGGEKEDKERDERRITNDERLEIGLNGVDEESTWKVEEKKIGFDDGRIDGWKDGRRNEEREIVVKEGDTFSIKCFIRDMHVLQVLRLRIKSGHRWLTIADNDDVKMPFSRNDRYKLEYKYQPDMAVITLDYIEAKGEDSGVLECINMPSSTSSINITVVVPPSEVKLIHLEDSDWVSVKAGVIWTENVSHAIRCTAWSVSSDRPPILHLSTNNRHYPINTTHSHHTTLLPCDHIKCLNHYNSSSSVTFVATDDIYHLHRSHFVCSAITHPNLTPTYTSTLLIVLFAPKVNCEQLVYRARINDIVNITCIVHSNPHPQVQWLSGKEELRTSPAISVSFQPKNDITLLMDHNDFNNNQKNNRNDHRSYYNYNNYDNRDSYHRNKSHYLNNYHYNNNENIDNLSNNYHNNNNNYFNNKNHNRNYHYNHNNHFYNNHNLDLNLHARESQFIAFLIINQVKNDHYGDYSIIATNSLGFKKMTVSLLKTPRPTKQPRWKNSNFFRSKLKSEGCRGTEALVIFVVFLLIFSANFSKI